jgi:two-component system sensor histidine kinase QseC
MKSIRKTLSVWLIAVVMVMCALSAVYCYVRTNHVVAEEFDRSLLSRADALTALVHYEPQGKLAITESVGAASDFAAIQHPSYLQIWDSSGHSLQRSKSLGEQNIAVPDSPVSVFFWDTTLPDGRPGRAVRIRFTPGVEEQEEPAESGSTRPSLVRTSAPPTPSEVSLVVMRDFAPAERIERVVFASLAIATGALGLGVLIIVPLVVRHGLAKLRRLGEWAAGVEASTLSEKFEEAQMPQELLPICGRLNDLLGRLEDAFNRERRFTGNVAHELRTPISELKALAEVSIRWPSDVPAAVSGFREVLAITARMEAVVATLLLLARSESGSSNVALQPCNLVGVVVNAWQALMSRAAAKSLRLRLSKPEQAVMVLAEPTLLRNIVDNLLANAVEYSPRESSVQCRIAVATEDEVELTVANPAEQVSKKEAKLSLEPFWRKDPAGTDSLHAGLGLSLVASYAKVINARTQVDVTEDGLFRVRVRLKSAPPVAQSSNDPAASRTPRLTARPVKSLATSAKEDTART